MVFTKAGGMGLHAKMFYARVADMMSAKKGAESFFSTWLRTSLSLSLLRSSLLRLRESKTSRIKRVNVHAIDFEDTVL